jgi:hypothetical protein
MERLIAFAVRRYLGGPDRAWLFSGLALLGYRGIRSVTGRRELIDVGKVGKGQKIVIDHLGETHASQIRAGKRQRRAARSIRRKATRRRAMGVASRVARLLGNRL